MTDVRAQLPPDLMTSGLNGLLGVELGEAGPDRVVAHLDIDSKHHQPYGIVHGGVHCALVEAIASIGAALWFGDRGQVVGVHNSTNFIRAAREGRITAVATPIHRGRLQQLWLVEISDESERPLARGELRLQNLPSDTAQ